MPDDERFDAVEPTAEEAAAFTEAAGAEPASDEEAAFQEAADEEAGKETGDDAGDDADDGDDSADDNTPDEKDSEQADDADESKEDEDPVDDGKELSAMDKLNARIAELKGDDQPDQTPAEDAPASEGDKPQEEQPPQTKQPSGAFSEQKVQDYLKAVNLDELPGEIKIGDDVVDLKDFASSFPDDAKAVVVLAGAMFEQMKAQGNLVDANQFGEEMLAVREELRDMRFWQDVADQVDYPNPLKVASSKEFLDWKDNQPKKIQDMADNCITPEDAVYILDAFHEDLARGNAKAHDSKKAEDKKAVNDIHKNTSHGKRSSKSQTHEDDLSEEDAFAQAAAKEDELL